MTPEEQKELWRIRFEKILQLEQESFDFYQKLLKEKGDLLEEAGIKSTLKQILSDEGKHIRIAKELVHLVNKERAKT